MADLTPETPHQLETPVQLLFALGQLTGNVSSLSRAVETLNGTIGSLAKRIDALEADNDRRKGQNSILTIAVSAGVSLAVVVVAGIILWIIKGS